MNTTANNIESVFVNKQHVNTSDLLDYLSNEYPGSKESTLRWHIYKLNLQGIIKHVGRGLYSLNSKPLFSPDISASIKRLSNDIVKNFPYISFCVWDSRWFNEFMVHQSFKSYLVIEVEKDAVEPVFYKLSEKHHNVYCMPNNDIYEKYIVSNNEAIIIVPLISEAPLQKVGKVYIPAFEKLLVDCLTSDNLFRTQQGELEYIFETAFSKYNISPGKLKRYAGRRNQAQKIELYINKYSANTAE